MRCVAQGFVCVYARLHMAATPDKRRAVRASQRSDSVEKVEDAGNASYCRREAYLPVRVTECVTVSGGYLKQPVVVTGHRHCDRVYVQLEHCDWVCKIVSGKSRAASRYNGFICAGRLRSCTIGSTHNTRRQASGSTLPRASGNFTCST